MQFLVEKLEKVKENGLFRKAKLQSNRRLLNNDYSSSDYLSLGNSIRVRLWLIYSIVFYGKSLCASKYLGGYSKVHKKLEDAVAFHCGCEQSLIFGSGYLASIGILQGICDYRTIIVADKHIHASWIDGIMATKVKFTRFEHDNLDNLKQILQEITLEEKLLNNNFKRKIIILTETVFSMDGTVIDLPKYVEIAREFGTFLITDNAHGLGVVALPKNDYNLHIQMGTFSKACAGFGGYVAANETIVQSIANFGRTQIYSSSLPEYVLSYNLLAFNFVCRNSGKMLTKAKKIAEILGLEFKNSAILIKKFDNITQAEQFQQALIEKGIYAPVIRPPTVKKPMIRLCVRK